MTAGPSSLPALHLEDYAAAREAAVVVDLAERGVLEATGPQRQKFLQGMLTSEVEALSAGEGRPAALLDVKGHVQALLRVLVTKSAVLLETRTDRLPLVERTLNHYKVAAPVRFRVVPSAVLALLGPRAEDVLRTAGGEAPAAPAESHVRTSLCGLEVTVARAADVPPQGFALHIAPEDAPRLRSAFAEIGVRLADRAVLDALRIEALRPWLGEDVTEENLLHETGLVPEYCSFTKGCYLGQEVVARLDARGGQREQGVARAASVRPRPEGGARARSGEGGRSGHHLRVVAPSRAGRPRVRASSPLRPRHRGGGGGGPGDGGRRLRRRVSP